LADIIHQTNKSKVLRLQLLTELKERKIMKESTFSIFNSIGSARILFQPEIKKFLPSSQNALYRVATKLTTDDIKNNVKKGNILPNSSEDEIIEKRLLWAKNTIKDIKRIESRYYTENK
jgi:hypothetical protein